MICGDVFFLVVGGKLVVWDFRRHQQFELSFEYAMRLIGLVYGKSSVEVGHPIDQDFLDAGIISMCSIPDAVWGWDVMSKIFHLGTKSIPVSNLPDGEALWAEQYIEHCQEALGRELPVENASLYGGEGIPLPLANCNDAFHEVLKLRSTSRAFLDESVQLDEIAQILSDALGFVSDRELPLSSGLPAALRRRRSSPSGGGLNATEGYLYARRVVGLKPGLYYYEPVRHELHIISPELPQLGALLAGQHFINDLPAGVFLTSRFDKLWWKYEHSRTYRMALVEVGHVAQTFQLSATAVGLSTWLTGALTENSLDPYLRLLLPGEEVLFFVGCGHSDGFPIPKILRQ